MWTEHIERRAREGAQGVGKISNSEPVADFGGKRHKCRCFGLSRKILALIFSPISTKSDLSIFWKSCQSLTPDVSVVASPVTISLPCSVSGIVIHTRWSVASLKLRDGDIKVDWISP